MALVFPPHQIANISVPSGPLIDSAIELAYEHLSLQAFNHVMRSFLFGVVIAAHVLTPHDKFDAQVHALSAILHDLGWDKIGTFISKDKRFEVDGAIAARNFISKSKYAKHWPHHRVQLVWDSIALHTIPSISNYKENEVRICGLGIGADFLGPDGSPPGSLSHDEYDAIVKHYPRTGFVQTVKDVFIGLCRTKPATTYDNVVGDIGEVYVKGYSRDGHR
ncbi:MAG: hypothetical protein LQ342_004397 [Letrouitia transgressa]|nr:MAG: hypothetical protein LQ342_004397 [Letrouitia transgressa]